MTLMRIHCPVCEAACEASDEIVAATRHARCGRCGLVFTPSGMAPISGGLPCDGQERLVPPPPDVIYVTQAAPTVPVPPANTPESPPVATEPASPSVSIPGVSEPGAAARTLVPERGLAGDFAPQVLGPPPPYRPSRPAPRPAPPRVEMAPTPTPAEPNIRTMGALGPPPPYRPIIQAGSAFQRGPAPDLEPWRLASRARAPGSLREVPAEPAPLAPDPEVADWSLTREPEPKIAADPTSVQWARSEHHVETASGGSAPAWPADAVTSDGPRLRGKMLGKPGAMPNHARRKRPVLWAAGVATVLTIGGVAAYAERGTIRRSFFGSAGHVAVPRVVIAPPPAAVAQDDGTSAAAGDCTGGGAAASTDPAERRDAGCEASQSTTTSK